MLLAIGIVLVILWLVGFVLFHVTGFLIQLLLVIGIIAIILRLLGGRRPTNP